LSQTDYFAKDIGVDGLRKALICDGDNTGNKKLICALVMLINCSGVSALICLLLKPARVCKSILGNTSGLMARICESASSKRITCFNCSASNAATWVAGRDCTCASLHWLIVLGVTPCMACCAKLGLLPGITGVGALLTDVGVLLVVVTSAFASVAATLFGEALKLTAPAAAWFVLVAKRRFAGSTTSLATTGLGVMAAETEAVLLLNW